MSRRQDPGAATRPVRVLTVLPADPEQMRLGGIASFVRGFAKFAPDDFELGFLGLSETRPLGEWCEITFEGRSLQFFPVGRLPQGGHSRIPLALRLTTALLPHRRAFASRRWIPAFHRPGTDLAFPGRDRPMWRVVHLSVDDLTTTGSESRWRPLGAPLAAAEGRSFARMARVYVVNQRALEGYRARFANLADRFAFLPNWADPTIFHPTAVDSGEEQRAAQRAELGVGPDARVLLFAARLEGQKDPLLLARAVAALRAEDPQLHLLVAGDGALAERDARRADRSRSVRGHAVPGHRVA